MPMKRSRTIDRASPVHEALVQKVILTSAVRFMQQGCPAVGLDLAIPGKAPQKLLLALDWEVAFKRACMRGLAACVALHWGETYYDPRTVATDPIEQWQGATLWLHDRSLILPPPHGLGCPPHEPSLTGMAAAKGPALGDVWCYRKDSTYWSLINYTTSSDSWTIARVSAGSKVNAPVMINTLAHSLLLERFDFVTSASHVPAEVSRTRAFLGPSSHPIASELDAETRAGIEGAGASQSPGTPIAQGACEQCGGPIDRHKHPRARICSHACDYAAEKAGRLAELALLDRRCLRCQKPVPVTKNASAAYCTKHCRDNARMARHRGRLRAAGIKGSPGKP